MNKYLKTLVVLLFVSAFPITSSGEDSSCPKLITNYQDVIVCTKQQLTNAILVAQPGTRIRLCNGVWKDIKLKVKSSGTESSPIMITTNNPGGVTISGNSYIEIIGSHIHLSGFRWANYGNPAPNRGYIQTGSGSSNVKISEMVFKEDKQAPYKEWIFNIALRGKQHEVFNSAFLDKYGKGAQMFVWEGGENLNHDIHHLYFRREQLGFENGQYINGGESLQLGAGDGVELPADEISAHHLFFENASGEPEIISIKGNRQKLSDIVMIGCQGMLSLRDGNYNQITRLYIDGQNKPNAFGVRVLGDNHVIRDMFVKGISSRWKGGVFFESGTSIHNAADNILVEHATLIDTQDAITIGTKGSTPPSNINFNSIIAVQKTTNDRVLFVSNAEQSYRFSNSFLFGKNNTQKLSGAKIINPKMIYTSGGLYTPDINGPAFGHGSKMQEIPVSKFNTGPQTYQINY